MGVSRHLDSFRSNRKEAATLRIVMEVYTRTNTGAQREAMETMQQAFTQKREDTPGQRQSAA